MTMEDVWGNNPSNSWDREVLAKEMFPAEYAAITDDKPMDPAKVALVEAELIRRTSDVTEDKRRAMHGMISEVEKLARYMRLISDGNLSLAVVHNYAASKSEREGMGWHNAHLAADKIADGTLRGAVSDE
jgi:hypothetical protein